MTSTAATAGQVHLLAHPSVPWVGRMAHMGCDIATRNNV